MVDYRGTLLLSDLYSQRKIVASVGSSHHTVIEVLETAKSKGIKWPLDDDISNEVLQSILFPEKYAFTSGYMGLDYEHIHTELAKPGVTLTLLWAEYNEKCVSAGKRPYIMTQFVTSIVTSHENTKATMGIHHKPGDAMEGGCVGLDTSGVLHGYRRSGKSVSVRGSAALQLIRICGIMLGYEGELTYVPHSYSAPRVKPYLAEDSDGAGVFSFTLSCPEERIACMFFSDGRGVNVNAFSQAFSSRSGVYLSASFKKTIQALYPCCSTL